MLLAIDIGNTNISCGVFSGNKLKKQFDLPSKNYKKTLLVKKLGSPSGISAVVICSVVPRLTRILERDLKPLTGSKPYIIGRGLPVPIKNRYRFPDQVGQDRLVNAYAASSIYSCPLIVIDSGTAITFDVISGKNEYLGGLIFPGMRISLEALGEKTALLPLVKLRAPEALIGRDTQNSILSGIVFGTAALTKELAEKIKGVLGKDTRVIGTGGNISLINKYAGMRMEINKDLTLLGIKLVYEGTVNKKKS